MYRLLLAVLFFAGMGCRAQNMTDSSNSALQVPLPPLSFGNVSSLWYDDHRHVMKQYGDFDLVNVNNTRIPLDSLSSVSTGWKFLAIGNFLDKGLHYATVARPKNNPSSTIIIMFRWKSPEDTAAANGVFFTTLLNTDKVMLRTKQCHYGKFDTLEISCADIKQVCNRCYYDVYKKQIVLKVVGKER